MNVLLYWKHSLNNSYTLKGINVFMEVSMSSMTNNKALKMNYFQFLTLFFINFTNY